MPISSTRWSMTSQYLTQLLEMDVLRRPALRDAALALALAPGSHGLDAGCGAGLQCIVLSKVIGPEGRVTGLDISPDLVTHGRQLVRQSGLEEQITLMEGDIADMPFGDAVFDWVWSADCVGYGRWNPMPMLLEMKRVTCPGGTLAILAWSSEQLLPGFPILEARLRATAAGISPFTKQSDPSAHFSRSLGLMKKLGLRNPKAATVAGSIHAPLSPDIRTALIALFEMRWPGAKQELSEGHRAEFERLCVPDSPECVLNLSDYYAFFTYSIISGTV
jgi:ubiquinone/menaquinone biosynthesis C-methylase UbiE